MKRIKLALIGGVVAVALAGVAIVGRGEEAPVAAPAALDVATAELRDLEVRAEASGEIEPIRVVEVKSKASGEILRLRVETGDFVQQGAVLAEIDPRDVQNSLDQAEADLQVAQVQAQTARAQRARVDELRRANAMTQQELESAVQSEASAEASLVRARTNLQLARVRRQDVQIAAPIAGTVIERTVEAGQIISSATSNVSGGTTLVKMADLSQMQVRTLVDETDIGRVASGQTARVSVDAFPGRVFVGSVLKIEPQAVVEQNVTMFPVLVQLENGEGLLKPGMNAEVVIEIARRSKVLTVPSGAVTSLDDAPAAATLLKVSQAELRAALGAAPAGSRGGEPGVVFVQGPQGPVARRVVRGVSDWESTEIVEGLKAGDRVLLVSVARMRKEQADDGPNPFGGGDEDDAAAGAGKEE
jgi:HlyD family secretion protein